MRHAIEAGATLGDARPLLYYFSVQLSNTFVIKTWFKRQICLFVFFSSVCVFECCFFFSSVDLIFSSNMSLSVVCLFVYKCVFVIYYCFFLFICICSIVKRIGITFSGLFVCLRHSLLVCFRSPVSEFLSCK